MPADLIPRENVPIWLKAAVFISGSMVVGAMCAHFSGSALWQKKRVLAPVEATAPLKAAVSPPTPKAAAVEPEVPKAIAVSPPVVTAPVDNAAESGRGVSLALPPGATGLREQLAPAGNPPAAPPR